MKTTITITNGTSIKLQSFSIIQGADGKSTYQVAVDNGFVGTEEEWLLSLVVDGTLYDDTAIQASVSLNTAKVGITTQQASDITANNAKESNINHPLVEKAVPSDALFTDTIFDDTTIQAAVALNTAKETNITHPLVETAVPIGAKFTDTLTTITDTLISASTTDGLSAKQGAVLKGLIDNINTLLLSDTAALDTLQEIVDFINLNKSTLDSLGITNIVGLQNALDLKANVSQVLTDVPTGALFTDTDTVYDDTAIQSEVTLNTAKVGITTQQASDITTNNAKVTYPSVDSTKLAGIESGATADQSDAEIKTAYENNANTNAYTDAEKVVLANQSGTNTGDQDLSGYEPTDVTIVKAPGGVLPALDGSNLTGITGGAESYTYPSGTTVFPMETASDSYAATSIIAYTAIELRDTITARGIAIVLSNVAPTGMAYFGVWKFNESTQIFDLYFSTPEIDFTAGSLPLYVPSEIAIAETVFTPGRYLMGVTFSTDVGILACANPAGTGQIFKHMPIAPNFAVYPSRTFLTYNGYGDPAVLLPTIVSFPAITTTCPYLGLITL